jgi:hypothetical protein
MPQPLQIAEAHSEMPVSDLAAIHIGLARFAGAVYPDDLDHVDAVLAACTEVGSRVHTMMHLVLQPF